MKIRTIIWPVPYGVRVDSSGNAFLDNYGNVTLDNDGKESCDYAIQYVHECVDGNCLILPVAGRIPAGHGVGSCLSTVMYDYLVKEGVDPNRIQLRFARSFSTIGEAYEIMRYVESNPDVRTIVICVKYWHATRCLVLLKFWLRLSPKTCNRRIRIRIEACPSLDTKNSAIEREFWWGTPKNMVVMGIVWILYKARLVK